MASRLGRGLRFSRFFDSWRTQWGSRFGEIEIEDDKPKIENGPRKIDHQPVMVREVLEFLDVRPEGTYIDATVGAGGHAEEILKRLRAGRLLALDCDPAALEVARKRLEVFRDKLRAMHGNFAEIDELHKASGLPQAGGVLADLGMSSMQVDDASRGFSFASSGPLDMRMDPNSPVMAEEIINRSSERDLADLIFKLGEERHSRRIARAIVKARPIRSTTKLAQVVTRAIPRRAGLHQIHPATRTFMALRLAVNAELENLESFLPNALSVLAPGGRLVILSFHSLEDRLVKHTFASWRREGRVRVLTPKVVRPGDDEVRANGRARSAKLRACEKQGSEAGGCEDRG